MSKINYPENGIYYYIKDDIASCIELLGSTLSNTDYQIPKGFYYRAYMNDLKEKLNEYNKEINNINDAIMKTDKALEELEEDLVIKSKTVSDFIITERTRMIKE